MGWLNTQIQKAKNAPCELIEKYKNELESFGVLRFQTAKPMKGTKGGAPETIYLLNEQQSTSLMKYVARQRKLLN